MPDFVSDEAPVETPLAAADQGYAQVAPGLGDYAAATIGAGPSATLTRAAERGGIAGSSWFDRLLAGIGPDYAAAESGAALPEPTQSPMMAPADYNRLYAPVGADGKQVSLGDQPMPQALAQLVGQQKSDEMRRDGVIARFDNAHGAVTNFAVGALASLADPINAAALFVPVLGEGAIGAGLARAGITGLTGRVLARAGAGALTGAAIQAPVAGLEAALAPEEASDYGIGDALREVAYSAAGFAAFHAAGATLGEILGHTRPAPEPGAEPDLAAQAAPIVTADAATNRAAMGAATAQVLDGRPVDVAPFFYRAPAPDTALGGAVSLPSTPAPIAAPTPEEIAPVARQLDPEAFAARDRLMQQQDDLRQQIAAAPTTQPEDHPAVTALDTQIASLRGAVLSTRGAARRDMNNRIIALEQQRAAALAAVPAPEQIIAPLRQQIVQNDLALRDLGPRFYAANAQARQRLVGALARPAPSSAEDTLLALEYALGRGPAVTDYAAQQRLLYQDGYAAGVAPDEFAATQDRVYGAGSSAGAPEGAGVGGTPAPVSAPPEGEPALPAAPPAAETRAADQTKDIIDKTAQGEQRVMPGMERSAQQAAAGREAQGGRIRAASMQQEPGALFAAPERAAPGLFDAELAEAERGFAAAPVGQLGADDRAALAQSEARVNEAVAKADAAEAAGECLSGRVP